MIVKNAGDLIDCYARLLSGTLDPNQVVISDGFECGMRIRGDKWKGRVDTSLAFMVIDFQKNVRRAYRKAALVDGVHDRGVEKAIRAEFVVGKGSSSIVSILEKLLPVPALYMSSEHALYATVVIALTIIGVRHIEVRSELLKKIEDEKTKQKLIEMNRVMLSEIQASLKPFVKLLRRMDKENTLEFTETGATLTRAEAIEHFSVQHVPDDLIFFVDDNYEVTNVHLKSRKVTLEVRGIKFVALIEDLTSEERKRFFSEVDEAGVASGWPTLDMQVTLTIHGAERIARVLTFGPQRPNSVTIEHALFVSGIANESRPQQRQLPLLDFAGD